MSHTFAMSLTRPHEALGLPQPLARRIPHGILAWNLLVMSLTASMVMIYVFQVNTATSKGYSLREVEKKVDGLKTENLIIQDKMASMSSIQTLNVRAAELGFVPVEKIEYVNPAVKSYALR